MCQAAGPYWCRRLTTRAWKNRLPGIPLATQERLPRRLYSTWYLSLRICTSDARQLEKKKQRKNKKKKERKGKESKEKKAKKERKEKKTRKQRKEDTKTKTERVNEKKRPEKIYSNLTRNE